MSLPREATIYDIAKKLNISAATVSRSLKDHPAISKKTKKEYWIRLKKWATAQIHLQVIYGGKKPIP
jgi:transcriptional antiterminator